MVPFWRYMPLARTVVEAVVGAVGFVDDVALHGHPLTGAEKKTIALSRVQARLEDQNVPQAPPLVIDGELLTLIGELIDVVVKLLKYFTRQT